MTRYTYGDDREAKERLRLVAAAYEPVSRAFLAENARGHVGVAVDLGCGPGFSTRLLEQVFEPSRLVGMDASDEFVEMARREVPRADFVRCDLATDELPLCDVDVAYSRLLLAHLPDPLGVVERWRRALSERGMLLIEDLDHIEVPPGPLREYDEFAENVVRSGGGLMYGGAALEPLGGRLTAVTVPVAAAARIYLFNARRWLSDPGFEALRGALGELVSGLEVIARQGSHATASWVVRQVSARAIQ